MKPRGSRWSRKRRERSEFTRQGEDQVHVAGGQQFPFARLEPAETRVRLASGTVPVAARVIGDGSMPTVRTAIAMAAQCGGAAAGDREQDLLMLPGDPAAAALDEAVPGIAKQYRPSPVEAGLCAALKFSGCWQSEGIQWTGGCAEMSLGQMQVDGRYFEVAMAEQYLNGA
jgi:hypothetical protein